MTNGLFVVCGLWLFNSRLAINRSHLNIKLKSHSEVSEWLFCFEAANSHEN